jgi:phosphoribosylaminoimidazole-succinocarboxamide synthase
VAVLSEYPHIASGKVRDLYAVDDAHLLMVASDRISAFDHVLPTRIPDKGRVLTALSVFWFELLSPLIEHHLAGPPDDPRIPGEVRGRALLVRRLEMIPVECVARGYLAGSALPEYADTGAVCGVTLPPGLAESARLPAPVFTPATKAVRGEHDENITFDDVVDAVGPQLAARLRDATLEVYQRAAGYAESRGLILADTKLEFGLTADGELVLADEVLTPDSSRFWPLDGYAPGRPQPAFDKQYVRDWLTSPASGWDRHSGQPPPPLPDDVVAATRARYLQAYRMLTGRPFDE